MVRFGRIVILKSIGRCESRGCKSPGYRRAAGGRNPFGSLGHTVQSSGPGPDSTGDIAQLGERLPCTQEVTSSNLVISTSAGGAPHRGMRLDLENCIEDLT
jgi:hypothetical protein